MSLTKETSLILGSALFVFAAIYLLSFHSPIVADFGVLIDRSYRIYRGQIPCRDFYCPSTPLTFMIQAWIYKIFSPKVFWMKLYLAGQMSVLLLCAGWIMNRILKVPFKFFWLLLPLFIVWLPGAHLTIPWYDIDALFFTILALCALCLSFDSESDQRQVWGSLAAGIFTALSFLSKQNIGGACAIAGSLFILFQSSSSKVKARNIFIYLLGISIPLSLMALYFVRHDALKDALEWFFARATQRHGKGQLLQSTLKSFFRILFVPENNFLKFILIFYGWALILTGLECCRNEPRARLRFGIALFSVAAMGITILHFHGNFYPNHQIYLGFICGILLTARPYANGSLAENMKKPAFIFLLLSIGLLIFWGGAMRWRQEYTPRDLNWSVDHPRIKGLYFRKEDSELVKGLVEFEKTIPKEERVLIMPDPLFFYFAADRLSPVPVTNFLITEWEMNEEEKKQVSERLVEENVRWVIIGKEEYFDTGLLRFGLQEDWETAVKNNKALMSRGNYSELRSFIDANYEPVDGPKGFWVLRKKD